MEFAPSWNDEPAFQRTLSTYNRRRLTPGLGEKSDSLPLHRERKIWALERQLIAQGRKEIAPYLEDLPQAPRPFVDWFEALKQKGPGQGDRLFPWLAEHASLEEMRWFLEQEVAGEAGFDDLLS